MQTKTTFVWAAVVCASAMFFIAGCAAASSSNEFKPPVQAETPTPAEPPKAEPNPAGESPMSASIETLVAANNEFGFDLFNQLRTQDKDKNVFCSPLSVATALAMTYNGAAGDTHLAMKRALKYGSMNHADINQSSQALLAKLKSPSGNNDPKVELLIANSLWAKQGVSFNPAFLDRNRQFFGAEVAALDFASPQAVKTINGWVNQNTKGKIPTVIEQIDGNIVMFLLNAVYFKGQWQNKFDKARTQDAPFHLANGGVKQVPMMWQSGSYQHLKGENFQAVSLPYGQGGTSIYLFLPNEGVSLNSLLGELNFSKWQQWASSFRTAPGDVKLPRFKMDYARELNQPLKALGMEVAFDRGRADFSGIREQKDLYISQVKHKAVIELNEEGTEAAATTSVAIGITSVRREPERFNFVADRPFLLAIRDQQTGAILFLGAVFEPM
ncbi:MAG: serpin family protein [Acidobacteriota bacterium]|nr:serpin family protein [Acidobacteriota bacterium]